MRKNVIPETLRNEAEQLRFAILKAKDRNQAFAAKLTFQLEVVEAELAGHEATIYAYRILPNHIYSTFSAEEGVSL